MDVSPLTPLTPGDQGLHGVDAPAEHQESPIAHSSSSSGGYPLPPRAEAPDGRGWGSLALALALAARSSADASGKSQLGVSLRVGRGATEGDLDRTNEVLVVRHGLLGRAAVRVPVANHVLHGVEAVVGREHRTV